MYVCSVQQIRDNLSLLNPKFETVDISSKLIAGCSCCLGKSEDVHTSRLLSIHQATITACNTCARTEVSMNKLIKFYWTKFCFPQEVPPKHCFQRNSALDIWPCIQYRCLHCMDRLLMFTQQWKVKYTSLLPMWGMPSGWGARNQDLGQSYKILSEKGTCWSTKLR